MGEEQSAVFSERHGTRKLSVEIEGQVVDLTIFEGNSRQEVGSTKLSAVMELLYGGDGHAAMVASRTYTYSLSLDDEYVALSVDPHLEVEVEQFKKLFPQLEDEPA